MTCLKSLTLKAQPRTGESRDRESLISVITIASGMRRTLFMRNDCLLSLSCDALSVTYKEVGTVLVKIWEYELLATLMCKYKYTYN